MDCAKLWSSQTTFYFKQSISSIVHQNQFVVDLHVNQSGIDTTLKMVQHMMHHSKDIIQECISTVVWSFDEPNACNLIVKRIHIY